MTHVLNLTRLVPPEFVFGSHRKLIDHLASVVGVHIVTFGRPVSKNARCHYCGGRATSRDHIVARSDGGRDAWWNLVPSCVPCNESKAEGATRCPCQYCTRAVRLWSDGYRRDGSAIRRSGGSR